MRIVVAPDKFKGSLPAREVAAAPALAEDHTNTLRNARARSDLRGPLIHQESSMTR